MSGLDDQTLKTLIKTLKQWGKQPVPAEQSAHLVETLMRLLSAANDAQLGASTPPALLAQGLLGTGASPTDTALQAFFQAVLDGSIPASDSIMVASNFPKLLLPLFGPQTLAWSPLRKPYLLSDGKTLQSVGLIASPKDNSGALVHLCSYTFAIGG